MLDTDSAVWRDDSEVSGGDILWFVFRASCGCLLSL